MVNEERLVNEEGEVRELTRADMTRFIPADELPASLRHKLGVRGRQNATREEGTTEVVTTSR